MRRGELFVLTLLVFPLAVPSNAVDGTDKVIESVRDLLPPGDFLPGWKLEDPPATYGPATLYQPVNGAAPLYLSYGFRELALARYRYGENHDVRVEVSVFDMGSLEGAFGVYSSRRRPHEEFVKIGTEGLRSRNVIAAWKGRFYVDITGDREDTRTRSAVEALARRIFDSVPGDDRYPEVLRLLPERNRVPYSEKYFAGDYLGYDFLRNAVSALYRVGSSTPTLFVCGATDTASAGEMHDRFVESLSERIDASAPPELVPDTAFAAEIRYMGKVIAASSGRYVYGLVADKAQAEWKDLHSLMLRIPPRLPE